MYQSKSFCATNIKLLTSRDLCPGDNIACYMPDICNSTYIIDIFGEKRCALHFDINFF